MTVRFLKIMMLLAGLLAFTAAANAQSEVVSVHVPFAFEAGGKLLPAGNYRVDRAEGSNLLLIHGASGSSAVFLTMMIESASTAQTASLVFAKQGEKLVLTGVKLPGQQSRVPVGSHGAVKSGVTISTVSASSR
jgi:hypothetical protein